METKPARQAGRTEQKFSMAFLGRLSVNNHLVEFQNIS